MTSCGDSPASAEPSPHCNATGLSQQSLPSDVSVENILNVNWISNIDPLHSILQLLPISSPCVDQQGSQQQQQAPGTLEKALESASGNGASSNVNNLMNSSSQGDAKSSPMQHAPSGGDDRVGASAVMTPSSAVGSVVGAGVRSGVGSGAVMKVGSSNPGKRKMDFSSNNSSLNSANYSGIASGSSSNNNGGNSVAASLAQLLLKRPTLVSHDYENIVEDELEPHHLLYDFSTADTW